MLRMLRYGTVLLTGFVFCSMFGCVSQEGVPRQAVSQEAVSGPLVLPGTLENSELVIVWENEVPVGRNEHLEQLFVLGKSVYALSNGNYLVSFNREKGTPIFSRFIAPTGFPIVGMELYKDGLFSVAGNKLIEINSETGVELGTERLKFGIACPAARNEQYFYIAATDRRIHALRSDDKVHIFEVSADDDSGITSVVADEEFVIFATDTGACASITADEPKRLWQFNAAGGIVAPVVRNANSLFFTSKDTYVYRIGAERGELVWKYQVNAVPEKGPRVGQNAVYQYVRDKGLTAIDKEDGKFLWQLAEGVDLLAESQGKAYVIASGGKLVVMDNKKAKKLCSVNLPQVSKYAGNMADSKIYIADDAGRIACLKPIE